MKNLFSEWMTAYKAWWVEYNQALKEEVEYIFSDGGIPPAITEKVFLLKSQEPKFPLNQETFQALALMLT